MAAASPERRTVHYSGRVQGVGFRYTTRRLAQDFSVTGFVQNLPDGRVLLVTEGTSEELNRFLARMSEEMNRYVREVDVKSSPATGEFTGFKIAAG